MPKVAPPRPIAPVAEKTAATLTTGRERRKRRGGSLSSGGGRRNTGIASLRIPLSGGNLRIN